MFGCQQVLIKADKDTRAIIEYLCRESNSLYNCSVYYARQIWFKTGKIVTGFDLTKEMKSNPHFRAGYASSMQQTCLNVGESFKAFKQLLKKSLKGGLNQKPNAPKYRKSGGLFTVTYPKKWLKLTNGKIRFPLGNQVKAWFGLTEFFILFPVNLKWESIKEVRIVPRNGCLYAEFVYKQILEYQQIQPVDPAKVLGIDHGLNNWLTCVSNISTSFIIDGKHLKSVNQWYNKQVATLKERKPKGFWSRTLAHVTEKRNRQMRDAVNKAARIVINHCLINGIGTIVFGWNQGQKSELNMGKKIIKSLYKFPQLNLKKELLNFANNTVLSLLRRKKVIPQKLLFWTMMSYLNMVKNPTGGNHQENELSVVCIVVLIIG